MTSRTQEAGRSLHRRLALGVSRLLQSGVTTRLLVLAMVPLVAIALLATQSVGRYRAGTAAAARIGRQVPAIDALVRLRQALTNEEVAVSTSGWSSRFHVAPEVISKLLGYGPETTTAVARPATDAALAALGVSSPVAAGAVKTVRSQVGVGAIGLSAALQTYAGFDAQLAAVLGARLSDLGLAAAQVAGGNRLAVTLGTLKAATDALQYGAAEATDVAEMILSTAGQATPTLVLLGSDTTRYAAAAASLASAPDPAIAGTWKKLTSSQDVGVYNQTVTTVEQGRALPVGTIPLVTAFKGAVTRSTGLFGIVTTASERVKEAAGSLQSSARATYLRWLTGSGLLGLLAGALALGLARSITGPLRRLAASARSVSAGHIPARPSPVGGPHETRQLGSALNDLTANLRLLEAKGRALASCDFDDPVLAESLPGHLGEAIASSVTVLSGSMVERDALQRRLTEQAFRDALTGLPNRALFLDRVTHAVRRAEREATAVAVLFIDLDEFKTVNDSLGHDAGDELLVAVARRLAQSARDGDTIARLGGDEFAVLVESGEMPQAGQEVASRVAESLVASFPVGEVDVAVRASIGIALSRPGGAPGDLMRDADLAMYLAKHNGKDRIEMSRVYLRPPTCDMPSTTANSKSSISPSSTRTPPRPQASRPWSAGITPAGVWYPLTTSSASQNQLG